MHLYDAVRRDDMTYCVEALPGQNEIYVPAYLHSESGLSYDEARAYQAMLERQGRGGIIRTA